MSLNESWDPGPHFPTRQRFLGTSLSLLSHSEKKGFRQDFHFSCLLVGSDDPLISRNYGPFLCILVLLYYMILYYILYYIYIKLYYNFSVCLLVHWLKRFSLISDLIYVHHASLLLILKFTQLNFILISANPDHVQKSFLRVLFPQTFFNFLFTVRFSPMLFLSLSLG